MAQGYQIDYLEFPSADGVRSRAFFAEAFEWTFVGYGKGYDGIEGAGIASGIDSTPDRTNSPLAVVRCADLVEAERAVVAAGGVITRAAFDFPGGRRFHFREPGGSELAVWVSSEPDTQ